MWKQVLPEAALGIKQHRWARRCPRLRQRAAALTTAAGVGSGPGGHQHA